MENYIRFDWAMKRLLRNKANFSVLEGLLTTLLNEKITIQRLLESESNQEDEFDKYNRVDMLAENSKGELLLIEVQMGRNNNFFINAGMVGGWRIGTHTKIKVSDPRMSGKYKDHGSFGLRNFHYGYTINIGYNHFALTAVYYRSTLFKDDKGPRVQQINIGLTFML